MLDQVKAQLLRTLNWQIKNSTFYSYSEVKNKEMLLDTLDVKVVIRRRLSEEKRGRTRCDDKKPSL